jgi:signal transduction histidine kinase/ActR/RegA family two-component response regulator
VTYEGIAPASAEQVRPAFPKKTGDAMKHQSIRWKTTLPIVCGGVVSVLLTAAGIAAFDSNRFEQRAKADALSIGSVLSGQAALAAVRSDRDAAAQVLASLQADGPIREAAISDASGSPLAEFHQASSSMRQEAPGFTLEVPLRAGSARAGTLRLKGGVPLKAEVLAELQTIAPWVCGFGLLVSAILAALLQSKVSAPIVKVANAAHRIAQTHAFEQRVEVTSSDELGVLARSLNTLIEEIQRRDAERSEDRSQLEQQVAERERVNRQLLFAIDKAEEASRLKGQFLANMSHEIRTPMNGILGFTQLVLGTRLTADQRDYLETVERSAEGLMQLLNDILDVAKIEAGKMELDRAPFSMRECVETSTRTMMGAAQQKGLEVGWDVDPQIPDNLVGDSTRIRQVLLNLIGNAVKFTDQGFVKVSVRMEPAPDASLVAHFTVTDTGPGIPEDKRQIIFEPFRQADGSTTRHYGGSGLGLAISSGLVDIMGGRIWLESEVGRGSTFHFTAPFTLGQAVLTQRAHAPAPTDCAPLNILVAEDNVVSQRLVMALLKERGHSVTLAANGCAVLDLVDKRDFDLILMDIQMPEVDGLQATAEIRYREGQKKGKHIPIIAMTAHAMAGDRERCLDSGMDGYIAKPIHPGELMGLITGITAQRTAVVSIQGAA